MKNFYTPRNISQELVVTVMFVRPSIFPSVRAFVRPSLHLLNRQSETDIFDIICSLRQGLVN